MKEYLRRATAWMLTFMMLFSCLPTNALAAIVQEASSSNQLFAGARSIVPDNTNNYDTYMFVVGDTTVSTQIIKSGDELYAPATPEKAGYKFMHWAKDGVEFTGFGEITSITGGAEITLTAVFEEVYYVFFMDGTGSDARVIATKEGGNGADIAADVTFPVDADEAITGWYTDTALENKVESVEINGANVTLYPKIEKGHWIVFDSDGGSYIEPVFVSPEAVTQAPTTPEKPGYTFSKWMNGSVEFEFGKKLEANVELKASWTANANTKYTIIYWIENANDEGYTVEGMRERTGTTDSTIVLSNNNQGYSTNNIDEDYREYFTYEKYDQNKTISGDGSTIVNVYFSRNEYTIRFTFSQNGRIYYRYRDGWNYEYEWGNASTLPDVEIGDETTSTTYSFTAKYESDISLKWPTSENVTTDPRRNNTSYYLYAFSGNNQTHASKRLVLTEDLIGSSENGSITEYTAIWISDSVVYHLHYMLQPVNGSNDHSDYIDSPAYNQIINAPESNWNQKTLDGFSKESMSQDSEAGNDSDYDVWFYYTRNQYDLTFYNVNTVAAEYRKYYEADISGYSTYVPTRPSGVPTDYEFEGWYTTQNCADGSEFAWTTTKDDGTVVNTTMPAHNITLYAKWAAPTFEGTIHLTMAGTGDTETITITYGSTINEEDLEQYIPEIPDGYVWRGWATKDGDVYTPFNFETKIYQDITLYPYYTSVTPFSVTYDENGGSGTVPVDSKKYADQAYADIQSGAGLTTDEDDIVFLYWNTEAKGSGTTYYPGDKVQITGNLTLYAIYGAKPAGTTLVYHGKSGTTENGASTHEVSYENNESITLESASLFTREGYTFEGWSKSEEATTVDFGAGEKVRIDNDDISEDGKNYLYAVWTRDTGSLTITKSVSGGPSMDKLTGISVTITGPDSYSVTIGADELSDGEHTITNLPTGSYTVTEDVGTVAVTGYTLAENSVTSGTGDVTRNGTATVALSNVYTRAMADITVTKTWSDNDNQDGFRPESDEYTVTLSGGEERKDITSWTEDEENDDLWTATATVYTHTAAGVPIEYDVSESFTNVGKYTLTPTKYTPATDSEQLDLTNTHTPETITINGTKTWDDLDDTYSTRPDTIYVGLFAGNEKVRTATVTSEDAVTGNSNVWGFSFTNLPKYSGGQAITYTVKELANADATTAIGNTLTNGNATYDVSYGDNYSITNTLQTGTLKIKKEVKDSAFTSDDREFTFSVTGNFTVPAQTVKVTGAASGTSITSSGETTVTVPVGTYTVAETDKGAYTYNTTYSTENNQVTIGKGTTGEITVTNVRTDVDTLKVTKVWDVDESLAASGLPNDISVYVDGTYQVTFPAIGKNMSTRTWVSDEIEVPAYDANGQKITHTVTENPVPEGYSLTDDDTTDQTNLKVTNSRVRNSLTITKQVTDTTTDAANTFTFTVSPDATKGTVNADEVNAWYAANKDEDKYADVTCSSGVLTVTLSASDDTDGSIELEDLPIGDYTVTETENPAYTQSDRVQSAALTKDTGASLTFLNTRKTFTNGITVTKKWFENNGTTPLTTVDTFPVWIGLNATASGTADSTDYSVDAVEYKTFENGEGTHTFTNLPSHTLDGKAITYTPFELTGKDGTPILDQDKLTSGAYEFTVDYDGTTVKNILGTAQLTIEKVLAADSIEPEDEQAFTLKYSVNGSSTQTTLSAVYDSETDKFTIANSTLTLPIGTTVTVVEDTTPGWTPSYTVTNVENSTSTGSTATVGTHSKLTVTNTYNTGVNKITAEKVWVAPVGTTLPTNAVIKLYRKIGTDGTYELISGWDVYGGATAPTTTQLTTTTTYAFENLEEYAPNGDPYYYAIKETTIPGGYATTMDTVNKAEAAYVSVALNGTGTITNRADALDDKVSVQVTKNWDIPDYVKDTIGSATFTLQRKIDSDEKYTDVSDKTFTVAAGVGHTEHWDELDKYDANGNLYLYQVVETFNDSRFADNDVKSVTFTNDAGSVTFDNVYNRAVENALSISKTVIDNTVGDDSSDEVFTIQVYRQDQTKAAGWTLVTNANYNVMSVADNDVISTGKTTGATGTVTLENGQKAVFTDTLAIGKYKAEEIFTGNKAQVWDVAISDPVTLETTGTQSITVTNERVKADTTAVFKKTWVDSNDDLKLRPDDAEFEQMLSVSFGSTFASAIAGADANITGTAGNEWTIQYINLPKYALNGALYIYTMKEYVDVEYTLSNNATATLSDWYSADKTTVGADGTITNTLKTIGEKGIAVTKEIAGYEVLMANDTFTITVTLPEGPVYTGNVTITPTDTNINHTLSGHEITLTGMGHDDMVTITGVLPAGTYSISETGAAAGNVFTYAPTYEPASKVIDVNDTQNAAQEFEVINTPETAETITGTKTWVDGNNAEGLRPYSTSVDGDMLEASDLVLKLYKTTKGDAAAESDWTEFAADYTWAVKDTNSWTYTYVKLPEYVMVDGVKTELTYKVEEVVPTHYKQTASDGRNFTNTINPDAKVNVNVTKTWDVPTGTTEYPNVMFNLLKDGTKVDAKTLTSPATTVSFTGLTKYDQNGRAYVYTVTEDSVPGYTTTSSVTSTSTEPTPRNVTIDYAFTNKYADEKKSVTVNKVWLDKDGDEIEDGVPESVTITVTGSNAIGTASPTTDFVLAKDNKYTFTNREMLKYLTNGELVVYTASENTVPSGYELVSIEKSQNETTKNDTFTVTNRYTGGKRVSITVTKNWDAPVGTKWEPATLTLYRSTNSDATVSNAEVVDDPYQTTKTETTEQTGTIVSETTTFSDLDSIAPDGNPYYYFVVESNVPDGFTSDDDGATKLILTGTDILTGSETITNTYGVDEDKVDITVTKQWKDGAQSDDTPDDAEVLVQLQKSINGGAYEPVGDAVELNKVEDVYQYTWEDQVKYAKVNGAWVTIVYKVVETSAPTGWVIGEPDGVEVDSNYSATITNNRAKSEADDYPVQKIWSPTDDADKFGVKVTVMRKANGVEETFKDVTLTAEDTNWTEYLGEVETHDVNGNPYEYYIENDSETYANEADADKLGWYTDTYNSLKVTNTRKTTSATVTKNLPNGNADGDKFQFEYFIDDVSQGTFWLDGTTTSHNIENLNVGDKLTVKEIKTTESDKATDVTYYTVDYGTHKNTDNTEAVIENLSETAADNEITVTNTRKAVTSMTLEKVVSDPDHNAEKEFTFKYRVNGVNGGAWQTVTRKDKQDAVALTSETLYVGDKVEIAEIEDADYVFPAEATGGVKTQSTIDGAKVTLITIDQLVDENDVVFTNTRKTSGLTVSKTVTKPATDGIDSTAAGDAVTSDASKEFTFTLKKNGIAEANAAYTIGTTALQTNANGEFKLKDGETATFTALEVGTYTITEKDESDWTVEGDATRSVIVATGTTARAAFTNKRDTVDLINLIQKIWQDNGNGYTTRPESVMLQVVGKAGDETVYTANVTLENTDELDGNEDTWERELTGLPKTHGGVEITYTAAEANVPAVATDANVADGTVYVKSAQSGMTVTNTLAGTADPLEFTKKWDDQNNIYNRRPTPEEFKAMLHLNGDATIEGYAADGSKVTFDKDTKLSVVETSDQNVWTITFTNLPLYTLNGVKYEYTLSEELTGNTASWYNGDDTRKAWTAGATDTELNNSLKVADITVTKKLIDSTDNANDQTFAITATYDYAHEPVAGESEGTSVTETQILKTENLLKDGKITFTDIPVGGELNVSEEAIAGYTVKYYTDENAKAEAFEEEPVSNDIAVVVENTRVTTERSSEKVWTNIDNVKEPAVKISLYAKYTEAVAGENEGASTSADKWLVKSGETVTVADKETAFVTVDLGADFKNKFTNLPTHTKAGQQITYTIKETMVEVEGSEDAYQELYTMTPAKVDGDTTKVFTNTRKDIADTNNGLSITKTIVNGTREVTEAMKQDKFSFTVTMPADMKGGTMRYKVENGVNASETAVAIAETDVLFEGNTFTVNNVQHDQTITLMGLVVNGTLKPLLTGTYSVEETATNGNTFTYAQNITAAQELDEGTTEASFIATNTVNTGTVKITKKWQLPNSGDNSITPYVGGTDQAADDVKAVLALKKGDQELVSYEATSSNSMEVIFDVPKDGAEYTIVEKSQNGENYNQSTDVAKVKWNASANNGNGDYEFVGGTDDTIVNLLKRTDDGDSITDEIKIEKSINWNGTKPENITDANAFKLTYSYVDTDGETKTGVISVTAQYTKSGEGWTEAKTYTIVDGYEGTPVVVANGGGIILDNLAYGTTVTVTEDLGKYSEVWDKTEPDNATVKAETQTMTVTNTRNLFEGNGNIVVNKVWLDRLGEQNLADSLKQTVTAVLTGTVTATGGATYTDEKALESNSKTPWTTTFEKVPKADVATGEEYTYAVTEKNAENGKINLTFGEEEYTYDVTVTPESSSTSYTITNKRSGIATNGVTIKKTVTNGSDALTKEMENDSFTFEVTVPTEMEGMTVQYTIGQTVDEQAVTGGKLTFSGIRHNQTITLNGLVDGNEIVALAEGKYSVTESEQATGNKYTYEPTVSPAGKTDIVSGASQAFEVTNSTLKGSFEIKKLWENPNGAGYKTTAFDNEDAKVEFTLYTDASCQTALLNNEQPVKVETADNAETTDVVEATAKFENIPRRTYYVKETAISGTDSYVMSEQVLKVEWKNGKFEITDSVSGAELDTISNDLKHTTADNGALTITKDIQWKNTADKVDVTFDIGYAYELPDGTEVSGVIKAVATYDENGEETLLYKPARWPSDAQGIGKIALSDIPYGTTVTITESPNDAWKPSMSNVTATTVEGAVIAGTVTTDATNDEVKVTNTRVMLNPDKPEGEQGKIKVIKKWWPTDSAKPSSLSAQLLWNGVAKETKAFDVNWTVEFTDLPAYDLSGEPYTYSVLEAKSATDTYGDKSVITLNAKKADESTYSLYSYDVAIAGSQSSGEFTVTNTYKEPTKPTKTADAVNGNLGQVIKYTIERVSTYNVETAATITDTLPKGLTYNADLKVYVAAQSGEYAEVSGATVTPSAVTDGEVTISVTGVSVPKLGKVKVEYTATVNVDAIRSEGSLENNVAVQLGNEPNGDFQATEKTVDSPVLSIAKDVVGSTTVRTNDTVTYEIIVTNSGNAPAKNVKIVDKIPEGLNNIQISGGNGTVTMSDGRLLGIMIDSVPAKTDEANGTATVTITATVTALTGTIAKNLVTITEENGDPTGEDPTKEDPDNPFKDESEELEVKNPKLTITKSATDASGETDLSTKVFNFVLSNNKGYNLKGVKYTKEYEQVKTEGALSADGKFTLKHGESITFEVPIDVNKDVTTIYTIDENEPAWNLTYTNAVEVEGNDQKATVTFNDDANASTEIEVTATNVRKLINEDPNDPDDEKKDDGKLKVTKVWKEANGNTLTDHIGAETVTVYLYRTTTPGDAASYQQMLNSDKSPLKLELTLGKSWTDEFINLPATDAAGNSYTYAVKEVDEAGAVKNHNDSDVKFTTTTAGDLFFTVTIDQDSTSDGYTITNTLKDREDDPDTPDEPEDKPKTEKTADKDDAQINEVVTYTITDYNPYGSTTTATIVDTLPEGIKFDGKEFGKLVSVAINTTTLTSEQYTFEVDGQTLTWEIPNVPPMGSVTVVFEAQVTEAAVQYDKLTNTATISRKDNYGTAFKTDDDTEDVIPLKPALELIKEADAGHVAVPGETFNYKLILENSGDGRATGTVVTDELPEQVTFDGFETIPEGTEAAEENGVITWTVPVIEAGTAMTLEFTVKVKAEVVDGEPVTGEPKLDDDDQMIVNTAKIETQLIPDEDSDEETTPIARTKVEKTAQILNPDYTVKADQSSASLNDIIRFKVVVTNIGGCDLTNVVIEDKMLGMAIFDSEVLEPIDAFSLISGRGADGSNKYVVPELPQGYQVAVTYDYQVVEGDILVDVIANTATATATTPDNDEIVHEDSTETKTDDPAPALGVVKTITSTAKNGDGAYRLGETIEYLFTVTNTGNVTVSGLALTDKLTSGANPNELTEAIKLEKDVLAPGESTTAAYSYTVKPNDLLPPYEQDGVTIAKHWINNMGTVTGTAPVDKDAEGKIVEGAVTADSNTVTAEAKQMHTTIFIDSLTNEVVETITYPYGGNVPVPEGPQHPGWHFLWWTAFQQTDVRMDQIVYSVHERKTLPILDADIPLAGGYISNVGDCFD